MNCPFFIAVDPRPPPVLPKKIKSTESLGKPKKKASPPVVVVAAVEEEIVEKIVQMDIQAVRLSSLFVVLCTHLYDTGRRSTANRRRSRPSPDSQEVIIAQLFSLPLRLTLYSTDLEQKARRPPPSPPNLLPPHTLSIPRRKFLSPQNHPPNHLPSPSKLPSSRLSPSR